VRMKSIFSFFTAGSTSSKRKGTILKEYPGSCWLRYAAVDSSVEERFPNLYWLKHLTLLLFHDSIQEKH